MLSYYVLFIKVQLLWRYLATCITTGGSYAPSVTAIV